MEVHVKMNEKSIEALIIKTERTPEEKLKWQIETDLFYITECSHCETLFLIEESIDSGKDPEFIVPCPRCFNHNIIKKGQNRLLLQLKKIMAANEINPYYTKLSKNLEIKGIDY